MTSYLFPDAKFSLPRLEEVLRALGGDVRKLVIDLSCRRKGGEERWLVAMDKWRRETDLEVNLGGLSFLSFFSILFSQKAVET